MALTPEDVVNKRFQPTKFREGYDQDEVDDFLDEVVVELRRLGQENEDLRQRLTGSEARLGELQRSGGSAASPVGGSAESDGAEAADGVSVGTGSVDAESEDAQIVDADVVDDADVDADVVDDADVDADGVVDAEVVDGEISDPGTESGVEASAAAESAPARAELVTTATVAAPDSDSTNGLLQLARRLHEEHVREGVEKREALIAEGEEARRQAVAEGEAAKEQALAEAEAERERIAAEAETVRLQLIADGESVRERVVAEGESTRDQTLQDAEAAAERIRLEAETRRQALVARLDQERDELQERIDELQHFEREYRGRLKSYIEGQLRDLDQTGGELAGATSSADGD